MNEATQQTEIKPYFNERGDLVIPTNAAERYCYWKGGQSVAATLFELGAAPARIKANCYQSDQRGEACKCGKPATTTEDFNFCPSCSLWWEKESEE